MSPATLPPKNFARRCWGASNVLEFQPSSEQADCMIDGLFERYRLENGHKKAPTLTLMSPAIRAALEGLAQQTRPENTFATPASTAYGKGKVSDETRGRDLLPGAWRRRSDQLGRMTMHVLNAVAQLERTCGSSGRNRASNAPTGRQDPRAAVLTKGRTGAVRPASSSPDARMFASCQKIRRQLNDRHADERRVRRPLPIDRSRRPS